MNFIFLSLVYLVFAFLPVFFWMIFYFRKDLNPEPKKMIIRVFVFGMLSACAAAILELFIFKILGLFFTQNVLGGSVLYLILEPFLVTALIEEFCKYYAVKYSALSSFALDEPLDVMLYMVISALGFVALENMVLFFASSTPYSLQVALNFSALRFLSAVFLHTLTSSTIGFFLAISFCAPKSKNLIFFGFLAAIFFHGLYNLAILQLSGFWQYFIPALIIVALAVFTTYGFNQLKKLKSTCQITIK
jgi:RsiW-degrading membrane proteinase PrsW (M82 family)